jgi:hypothetical protein
LAPWPDIHWLAFLLVPERDIISVSRLTQEELLDESPALITAHTIR